MKTWTTIDKSKWPERGEWDNEPDKAYWVDHDTELDCLIVRNHHLGFLCGYVGVNKDHPFFQIPYYNWSSFIDDVNGGLTYSDFCQNTEDESIGICHKPEKGRDKNIWWFGFDCGHHWDISPAYQKSEIFNIYGATYKNFQFVKNEVEKLAAQLYKKGRLAQVVRARDP